ncbi:hypothetical protein COF51_02145 [Bacillus pseudomycoides]|uniref:hypothetical protein n=1 Tax=Bacillus pseudomycoides TaxID=64104 RepID=UPI000BF7B907|nr:hypothetical protein [Bacillus pseudomycoides]PGE92702.1 hypothetical protein COM62_27950 [Bacillus pseudomycoides]PHE40656.1 hypothetical protein COF51_02145 [Bacillus pseudomycoides]
MSFFKEAKLVCHICFKEIVEGEEFLVRLNLPTKSRMPVGVLDKVLVKNAKEILCDRCNQQNTSE